MYLLLAYLKFQSKLTNNKQQIIRLLQLKLFEKKDLMAQLRVEPPRMQRTNIHQLELISTLTGQ